MKNIDLTLPLSRPQLIVDWTHRAWQPQRSTRCAAARHTYHKAGTKLMYMLPAYALMNCGAPQRLT